MFRVAWTQTALDELADAWMKADAGQRAGITTAAQFVDRILQVDPENQGESRTDGYRVLFRLPLGLVFQVDRRQSLVRVIHVWIIRRRQPSD
jgi:hypothetical protein